jgi:signal peptidase I
VDVDDHVSGRGRDRALSALLATPALALLAAVVAALAGYRLMVVRTGSMTPTLRAGDVVVSRYQPAARIRPGDIVTFHYPGLNAMVTHRVVSVRAGSSSVLVTTKGDANAAPEAWRVPPAKPVAKELFRVPLIPGGYAALVVGLAAIGALLVVRRARLRPRRADARPSRRRTAARGA